MKVRRLADFSDAAEEFVKKNPRGSLSQSRRWAEFQRATPSRGKTWLLLAEEEGEIRGSCLLIRHLLGKPLGCWLYAHRGPVCAPEEEEVFDALLAEAEKICREEGAIFLRVDPLWEMREFGGDEKENPSLSQGEARWGFAENSETGSVSPRQKPSPDPSLKGRGSSPTAVLETTNSQNPIPNIQNFFQCRGFRPAHAQYQPLSSLFLDLKKTDEQLRAEMRPLGKRLLKKAEKQGFKISSSAGEKEIAEFAKLSKETAARQGFGSNDAGFFRRFFDFLGDAAKLFLARH